MHLYVPQVDVVKDAADWIAFAVALLSAIGTVVAIVYAVLAEREATKARAAVAIERRRQFELEVLREFLHDLESTEIAADVIDNPVLLAPYRHRLALLPAIDLPTWRALLGLQYRDDVSATLGFGERIQAANDKVKEAQGAHPGWVETPAIRNEIRLLQEEVSAVNREFERAVMTAMTEDVMAAIRRRVDATDA